MRCGPAWWNTLDLLAWPRANGDSSSTNAVNFSSARTMNPFPPSPFSSAIQIVRPLESIAETQPQHQPAFAEIVGDRLPSLHLMSSVAPFRRTAWLSFTVFSAWARRRAFGSAGRYESGPIPNDISDR